MMNWRTGETGQRFLRATPATHATSWHLLVTAEEATH